MLKASSDRERFWFGFACFKNRSEMGLFLKGAFTGKLIGQEEISTASLAPFDSRLRNVEMTKRVDKKRISS